jgi:rhomboid protease GluP
VIPSICPRCGGKNFQWASKCDHCGQPLTVDGAAAEPPLPQPSDDGERIVDLEAHRDQTFHASLAATTPHIFVTPVLIVVNLMVFLAMLARHVSAVAPPPDVLIQWGANYGPMTTHGQWWRLVTSAFLHIGVMHLFVNMFVLFVIGRFTERLFGNAAFLALYMLGAVAASLTSLSIHPTIVSAGASGAVFALYGGLVGFLLVRRSTMSYATATSLALNAIGFVAFNLFNGLTKPHIDMAAHVGGLLAGVPIGAGLAYRLATGTAAARLLRSAMVCAAGAAITVAVARRLPVLDDWPREFTNWVSFTRDTANRFNKIRDDGVAGRATAAQIAERIERELVTSVDAERARLERLRLLPDQQAVARKTIEYLSVQAQALRLTAAAERSRDPAVASQAAEKSDEAAEAMLRVIPDPKLAALLEERKAARASASALSAEIKAISDLEREQAGLYNRALSDYRSKSIQAEDLGRIIDEKLLPPWLAERDKLATLRVVPPQEPLVKHFVEYMSLRGEGWRLIAAGLRSNDRRLVEQGNAKQVAAKRLMEAKAPESLEPRSRGSQTPH